MSTKTQAMLLSLAVLLLTIPCLAAPEKKADGAKEVKKEVPAKAASAEETIEAALESKTQCEFIETPLSEVVEFFANKHDINIVVDKRALDDVGIPNDTPLVAKYSGIKLASALNLIFRPLDLTWTIQDEVLLITTPEAAESMLVTKVYAVTDLVAGSEPDPFNGGVYDYDSLIELIASTVAPTTWDEVGGPGSIAVAPLGKTGALVISQTYQVHRRIADLLEQLRKVAHEKPAKKSG